MKKIYDSLHGFIRLSEVEEKLINTVPFRRLHYISQLGMAYLVYPGAQHKRYEHSLGVMHLATLMFDRLAGTFQIEEEEYWRATMRLAALCHDLGHLPLSHTAEKKLLGEKGHEKWTERIIRSHYLENIWESEKQREDVIALALGQATSDLGRIISSLITGDFLGADRIDYLVRDAKGTGIAYGLFDYQQLIEMLCIVDDGGLHLGIEENGLESCEALLLARYFMYRRVYQHASVVAYSYHLSQFMVEHYKDALKSVDSFIALTDNEVLADILNASRTGDIHASALLDEEKRYVAIPLTDSFPDTGMQLHIETGQKKQSLKLDIPVLLQSGKVMNAQELSRVEIHFPGNNWAFVPPTQATLLQQLLREHEKTP